MLPAAQNQAVGPEQCRPGEWSEYCSAVQFRSWPPRFQPLTALPFPILVPIGPNFWLVRRVSQPFRAISFFFLALMSVRSGASHESRSLHPRLDR